MIMKTIDLSPIQSMDAPLSHSTSATTTGSRANDFYELTKPRMNMLVVLTTMVGFYMASAHGGMNWVLLIHTLIGTTMLAASSAVFNQLIERDFDALMPRTKNRPLPTGRIDPVEAFTFAMILGISGTLHLTFAVNALTATLGLLTLLIYVLIYTPMKRVTSLNTVVGAIPGAIPPMMGFTAVADSITPASLALFCILFFWQMPHFLAIATLYKNDYAAGGFKMLPNVSEGMTARQIILYGTALVPVSLIPTTLHITGAAYFVLAMLFGIVFLAFGISAAVSRTQDNSRKLFFASIIYLPLLMAAMMMDKL